MSVNRITGNPSLSYLLMMAISIGVAFVLTWMFGYKDSVSETCQEAEKEKTHLVTNQFAMAAAKGIGAIKVAFGIVLGIVCIVSVPREVFQKEYWVERKIAKQQKNRKRDPVNLPGERHR